MNHYSANFGLLQLVGCALAMLVLSGVLIFQMLGAKKTISSYDTIGSVVYRVDENCSEGYQVSYRV